MELNKPSRHSVILAPPCQRQAQDLPKFIGSKLDDAMLSTLLKAINNLYYQDKDKNKEKNPIEYITFLSKAQRFNVIKLFLSQEQKRMLNEMLAMQSNASNADKDELSSIRKAYDL